MYIYSITLISQVAVNTANSLFCLFTANGIMESVVWESGHQESHPISRLEEDHMCHIPACHQLNTSLEGQGALTDAYPCNSQCSAQGT